ncbi:hypothetical protein DXG03_006640 [Asterophora parasitica]|uniref:Uncharacterized protein n=1 Tax=Asterophora parasitica TaxID=117018 RepID=A0A9P7KC44_9AGAR|nr:hypothetical protein DXG03_006640 [Asterophora parasitica]
MIAGGIAVDTFTLLKIKHHLVQVTGFRDISVVPLQNGQFFQVQFGESPEIPDIAFPCVGLLLSVMDASHPADVAPSAMAGANGPDDRPASVLVGSIFVDVFLVMFCTVRDLVALPITTFKNMLETLCVIIYKHDFESKALKHLQTTLRRAVVRALDCLATNMSYELRQLALSAIHAFVKSTAIESVAKLVASQHQYGQDALAAQGKAFLDTILTKCVKFSQLCSTSIDLPQIRSERVIYESVQGEEVPHAWLFVRIHSLLLHQRSLDREFFVVLKQVTDANVKDNPTARQTLREQLLRDLFSRTANVDADFSTFQHILNNMQAYVENAITNTEIPGFLPPIIRYLPSFLGLVDSGIQFLQAHVWLDVDNDFAASLAVARMLLQVSGQDPTITNKLSDYGTERTGHTNLKVRSWSILAVAALLEPKESWYNALFAQLPSFSYAYHGSLRAYSQGANSQVSMVEINHAYVAIKLWILLAYKALESNNIDRDSQVFSVWNELWPPFEGLINQFEADSRGARYRLIRALRYMTEAPPETSFETLVNQAAKDLVAAEKLRVLEAKVVQERRAPERYRSNMRVA